MKYPQVLLLASRYDLTCDYIVARLRQRDVSYLRLNSEDLSKLAVELDPVQRCLVIKREGDAFCVTPQTLRSVLFRRPVYLRDYGDDQRPLSERFSRIQWAAFIQNLMLFKEALWVNDPTATYKAEHKAVQLSIAASLGFVVPETRVTNTPHPNLLGEGCNRVAIKGLDTVLLREDGYEMFGFTTFDSPGKLESDEWRMAPATIQAALTNKLDIRVTVVEDQVYAVGITVRDNPVPDDWRGYKKDAQFREYNLPSEVASRCRLLVKELGLVFGAIDLAYCDDEYYFLEINPTGEWAWLVDATGLPIDEAITDSLCKEVSSDVL